MRKLGPEAAKNFQRRLHEGFFDKYLSERAILDIGGVDPVRPDRRQVELRA
jgi:hypothetical protein